MFLMVEKERCTRTNTYIFLVIQCDGKFELTSLFLKKATKKDSDKQNIYKCKNMIHKDVCELLFSERRNPNG